MNSRIAGLVLGSCIAVFATLAHADARTDIQAAMKAQEWSLADEKLQDVLRKHPDNALAHYWRAEVQYKLGKIAEAQAELRRAREIDPTEKFAADKGMLARIGQAKAAPIAPAIAPAVAPVPLDLGPKSVPVPEARSVEPVDKPAAGHAGMMWFFVIAVAAGIVWLVMRSRGGGSGGQRGERERWSGALNDARKDLADAVAASDANPAFTQEVKLANYDRVKRAQSDLAAHQATLANARDFGETRSLVSRAHDIAAEIRGEERPSDREARLEQERRLAMPQAPVGPGYGMPGQPGPAGGLAGGLLGTAAAVGAGALLGGLLSESVHARPRQDNIGGAGNNPQYDPFPDDASQVDVGGSNAGSDAWETGGGGGGGDVDTSGDDSFD